MNTLACTVVLLLIGACGSASRTMTVEPSIESILVRVVAGGVRDVLARRTHEADWAIDRIYAGLEAEDIRLRIDGQPRTGVIAWAAAAYRVAGYVVDRQSSGAVEYEYRLRVRGFDVRRKTVIEDGRVLLTTDVYGRIGPRGELHHVCLSIRADETGLHETRIVGTATGYSTIGSRCWFLRWIAERRARKGKRQPLQEYIGSEIARELDAQLLGRVQAGGIDLYRAGSVVEVLR